jgi:hypothetical protein
MSDADLKAIAFNAGSVFTPGSPINGRDLFAGRLDQVKRILSAISQRGYHAVLYGERGIGKTSLSNVLSDFLRDTGHTFLLPRVNCDASDSFTSIWRKVLHDIVVTERKPKVGFSSEQIELTKRVVDELPTELTPDDVRRTLDNLSRGVILVVVLDEFDRIADHRARSLMSDTIKALSDRGSSATILVIGHLNMNIDEEALDEIASLSQGLPYITHLLSLHSVRVALGNQSIIINPTSVEAGIRISLDQWQQSIKSAYYDATRSQQPGHLYKEVILGCALADVDDLGYFSAAGVRTPLRIITNKPYDIPNFARHLKELSEPGRGDMLERTGGKRRLRYRFRSPLMRPYIVMRGFDENLLTKEQMYTISGHKMGSGSSPRSLYHS